MSDTQDMLSMISTASTTLTFHGEQVDAEKCVDESIKNIQNGLNQINVNMRNMLMACERDDSYEEMFQDFDSINSIVKDFKELCKDITSISKQLIGKKPKDFGMENLKISE